MHSRKKTRVRRSRESEKRYCREVFIRLYTLWERTHDSELLPMLSRRLEKLVKLEPKFDLRRQFEIAF